MNGSKKYIVFGLLIIAIASTGIAGFLIARNFISFKNSNGLPSENPVQSQVLISNPDNGFQLLGGGFGRFKRIASYCYLNLIR